jgi:chromosome segregation ATPase
MSSLDELERRIAAIEERLNVESRSHASGDRDLADMAQTLRAQQHTIQALAITQSQHNEKLDRHEEKLDRHEASLTAAHGKLDQIITMLGRLLDEGEGR